MTRPVRQLLQMALHFVLAVAVSVAVVALMLAVLPGEREATSRGSAVSACGPSALCRAGGTSVGRLTERAAPTPARGHSGRGGAATWTGRGCAASIIGPARVSKRSKGFGLINTARNLAPRGDVAS
ncbi:MAG: hypothetical protein DMD83_09635 [Candidatus Rokuibacteriota bacterium]|nr:MAG: hypothetical protein DMD83_09635 [Candidatus Rokubacteria bacterium]